MDLEQENKILKEKLHRASEWMQREVRNSEKIISHKKTSEKKEDFHRDSREEIITREIYNFFPPSVLTSFPENAVENIISSEIIFYQIMQWNHVDGTGVILWYQKVLDSMIELYITKSFRKFIVKNNLIRSPENSPLEKSLHSVVEKKYILSLGRLYGIIKNISQNKTSWHYEKSFWVFLGQKLYLKKALLETDFLLQLGRLSDMHAMWKKRHSGILSKEETILARKLLCWNFRDMNCILYILAASQSVDI